MLSLRSVPTRATRVAVAAAVVPLALALAACSGDDTSEADPAPTSSGAATTATDSAAPTTDPVSVDPEAAELVDDPVAIAEQWIAAFAAPVPDLACALQTQRFTTADLADSAESGFVPKGASCADGVRAGHEIGKQLGIDWSAVTVDLVDQSDGEATVRITFPGQAPTEFALAQQDGAWLIDEELGQG